MVELEKLFSPLQALRKKWSDRANTRDVDPVVPLETARRQTGSTCAPAPLKRALTIPCNDPTGEDRARDLIQSTALGLARQEAWDMLAQRMRAQDAICAKTDGGMPVTELMAFGARADVVAAVEHALISGVPEKDAPLLDGVEALEMVLAESQNDPMIAAIVAGAHVDIGWAWRGSGWAIEVPMRNRDAFTAHFDRAAEIIAEHDAAALQSPLLAATKCAINAGQGADIDIKVNDYIVWSNLDLRNTRAMRMMGGHLLPRWNGSYARLEREARQIAGHTHDVWGSGAYTWVMMDAISVDTEACARLDLDFFIEGLRDILRFSHDQFIVNYLAAYCANTMGDAPTGHDEADYIRARIAEEAVWIVRDHLRELHPVIWAHAARGFDNTLRVRCRDRFAASGYADALRYLSDVFRRELAAGKRVVFTPEGPQTLAS